MSKSFSVVALSTEQGLLVEYFSAERPNCAEDLLDDEIIRGDLANQPRNSTIYVEVESYLYGEGETVRASEEDLADLGRRFDELREGSQLDRIGAHSFSFPLDSLSLDFAEDREPEVWEDEDDLEL
ncbi:hypothetical protein [Flintibacter sp.]|uniref:hypothetical protein n=1 Tax=Flintibacter sp. TaxID=1918624 RepID=UPI003A1CA797